MNVDRPILTPKFLTKELVELAVNSVLQATLLNPAMADVVKRQAGHLVVLVPSMEDDRATGYPQWPNYDIKPFPLYQRSIGKGWEHEYDDIARCKALQLWHGRNDDRTDAMYHLLFSGDTPYWGGVKRFGLVVAFSGVQSYFDKMISGMVIEMIVALAYHAWMNSSDKAEGVSFLS